VRLKVIYGFGAWCVDYWRGECLGRGLVVEVVKGVKYAPKLSEMYKNGEKTGDFAHFLDYKSLKTLFFAQKCLTRYTHETFF
jgi:hypothetical protein